MAGAASTTVLGRKKRRAPNTSSHTAPPHCLSQTSARLRQRHAQAIDTPGARSIRKVLPAPPPPAPSPPPRSVTVQWCYERHRHQFRHRCDKAERKTGCGGGGGALPVGAMSSFNRLLLVIKQTAFDAYTAQERLARAAGRNLTFGNVRMGRLKERHDTHMFQVERISRLLRQLGVGSRGAVKTPVDSGCGRHHWFTSPCRPQARLLPVDPPRVSPGQSEWLHRVREGADTVDEVDPTDTTECFSVCFFFSPSSPLHRNKDGVNVNADDTTRAKRWRATLQKCE